MQTSSAGESYVSLQGSVSVVNVHAWYSIHGHDGQ